MGMFDGSLPYKVFRQRSLLVSEDELIVGQTCSTASPVPACESSARCVVGLLQVGVRLIDFHRHTAADHVR